MRAIAILIAALALAWFAEEVGRCEPSRGEGEAT